MAVAGIFTLLTGCETMGRQTRRAASEHISGGIESGTPEGSRRETTDARPRGAWSSEAASFEKNLTGRSVDPNW